MSELSNSGQDAATLRRRLLAGVSTASILAACWMPSIVNASEDERPTFWIELGAQVERSGDGQERFAPSFVSQIDTNAFTSPLVTERPPRFAIGGEGKLTVEPAGTNWIVSAAVRYGRSNKSKSVHQETSPGSGQFIESIPLLGYYSSNFTPADSKRFTDTVSQHRESYTIIDFQVGRDVGLGLFGTGSRSQLNVGVRMAQFTSRSTSTISINPDFAFSYKYTTQVFGIPANLKIPSQSWHLYDAQADITRSFHGIGPSAGWDSSAVLAGNPERTEVTADWGINASVLFGKQKVKSHHQTNSSYHDEGIYQPVTAVAVPVSETHSRSRTVAVPNIGGFAGLSLRFPNAKVSLGYRADVFFGAIDGGIDTRKTYDRAFYGPFATISIGLP